MLNAQERAQVVGKLSHGQIEALATLPGNGEVEVCTDEASIPVEHYVSEDYFEREKSAILHRFAVPVTPSAMLPKPNTAFAHDGFGIPLLLTRDKEGQARAFLNACTHRGAKLIDGNDTVACGGRLTCPFHAWTFGMDGALKALPERRSFPSLDLAKQSLRELQCKEAGGMIWVGLNPDVEADFAHVGDELDRDLAAFGVADMHCFKRKTFDLHANWKLIVEPFFEGYHVKPLHKNTVGKEFAAIPPVKLDYLDGSRTSRQTVGRGGFSRSELDGGDFDLGKLRKLVTHNYHLFPTAMMTTSPYHLNLITIMPRSATRTLVECYMLVPGKPETEKLIDLFERSFEFNFVTVFGNEDFYAATLCQKGLESGAIREVKFGGLEKLAINFHRMVEAEVARI